MANGFAPTPRRVLPDYFELDKWMRYSIGGWMPEVLPMGSISGIAYGGVCVCVEIAGWK